MLVTLTLGRLAAILAALAALLSACAGHRSDATAPALDLAAESYVRLVLALGERDSDSLDSYHGPPAWQVEARARRAALVDIQTAAASLAELLASSTAGGDDLRRMFLVRQLRAVVTRIDILRGRRPPFAEETRALFGVDMRGRGRHRRCFGPCGNRSCASGARRSGGALRGVRPQVFDHARPARAECLRARSRAAARRHART